jgi:cell division protein FtsB
MDDQYYRKPKPRGKIHLLVSRGMKNKRLLLTLLVAIPVSMFMLFSNRGILKKMSLETEKQEMQEKVHQAQMENQKLTEQSKKLDTDDRAIEKIAREKYGMIREGETVYKVKKDK